jgi:acetyl esterase
VPRPVSEERRLADRLDRILLRRLAEPGPEPARIEHLEVPVAGGRITVRLYVPHGEGPLPVFVFLHGGAWKLGTLDEVDPVCRATSAGATCVVASVDYRLAPENQFPVGLEDAYGAICWLADHADELGFDPSRLAVGGMSAGANLAAACCLLARDRMGPALCFQWLEVPSLDATRSGPSHQEFAEGYLFDPDGIDRIVETYVPPGTSLTDPYLSPVHAGSHRGLPPAFIASAELDPLCSDGERYAEALREAGVPVTHRVLGGHLHLSPAMTRLLPSAAVYRRDAIAALRSAFAGRA